MTYEEINQIKKDYLAGSRVQLQATNDSEASEPTYIKGTVKFVDEQGCVHIAMDNGEKVVATPGKDEIKHLCIDDQIHEAEAKKEKIMADKHRQRGRDDRVDERDTDRN